MMGSGILNYDPKKRYTKILFFLFCLLLISGCATVPSRYNFSQISISDYIDLESFCKEYAFQYNFDTIDDIIKIYSSDKEIILLLNSFVSTLNKVPIYLQKPPVYFKGKILLPRQIIKIISSEKPAAFRPPLKIGTVVIDPGHGGKDPGAISCRGLKEKTLNLQIAQYVKTELERKGFKVIMTRSRDIYLTLQERVNIARRRDADLFISIHANSNRSPNVNGVEFYYLSANRLNSQERALKLAKNEGFRGKNMPFDAKTILWDLTITKNYASSIELVNSLYFNFRNLGFKAKLPKTAPFRVLRFAYVPSVLIEVGYLSNYSEEKTLRKKHYQKQIAESIALSVDSLKKHHSNLVKR